MVGIETLLRVALAERFLVRRFSHIDRRLPPRGVTAIEGGLHAGVCSRLDQSYGAAAIATGDRPCPGRIAVAGPCSCAGNHHA